MDFNCVFARQPHHLRGRDDFILFMATQLSIEQNAIEQRKVAIRFGMDFAAWRSGCQAAEEVFRCRSRGRLS